MRTLLATALLGLMLAASPLAIAQDSNETKPTSDPERPDDAAWTEDCPPDMMCAFGGDAGNETPAEEPTYGDCGGEVCAYGDDACIECSRPVSSGDGATCMDGQQEGEACRDDVQYLDGRGPADCENCRGDAEPVLAEADAGQAKNDVPFLQVALVMGALAAAVLLVRRA